MNEHWEHKKRRSASMSNSAIDTWYQKGMENGALGGKLVGAGSGGFLLFYAKDTDQLRQALGSEGSDRGAVPVRSRRVRRSGPRLTCSASCWPAASA